MAIKNITVEKVSDGHKCSTDGCLDDAAKTFNNGPYRVSLCLECIYELMRQLNREPL